MSQRPDDPGLGSWTNNIMDSSVGSRKWATLEAKASWSLFIFLSSFSRARWAVLLTALISFGKYNWQLNVLHLTLTFYVAEAMDSFLKAGTSKRVLFFSQATICLDFSRSPTKLRQMLQRWVVSYLRLKSKWICISLYDIFTFAQSLCWQEIQNN